MRKRFLTFAVLTLAALGIGITVRAQIQDNPDGLVAERSNNRANTLVYDVACDARTFRLNKSGTMMDARRGDGFIVDGKIYPGGTIPLGGTITSPGTFNLDTAPGSIGKWTCRGTFNFDISDILGGAHPQLYSLQLHSFDNGNVLITDGPEGGAPQLRAITGGMKLFRNATGDVTEEPLGTNSTGLFNLRFTFKVKTN